MCVCWDCELTCWFWPSQVEQWTTASSSPQSETEGRGGRGEGRLWWIRPEQTDKIMCHFWLKLTHTHWYNTQKSDHCGESVFHPKRAINLLPPVFHSQPQTHTHRQYLLSRDTCVVERGGFQRQSNFFAVVLNLIEDGLDLLPPFLQHREAGQIWEQFCLVPQPTKLHHTNCETFSETWACWSAWFFSSKNWRKKNHPCVT